MVQRDDQLSLYRTSGAVVVGGVDLSPVRSLSVVVTNVAGLPCLDLREFYATSAGRVRTGPQRLVLPTHNADGWLATLQAASGLASDIRATLPRPAAERVPLWFEELNDATCRQILHTMRERLGRRLTRKGAAAALELALKEHRAREAWEMARREWNMRPAADRAQGPHPMGNTASRSPARRNPA